MRLRRIILATVLVFPLLTAGCLRDVVRELAKDFANTKNLQGDLAKRFGDEVLVSVEQAGGRIALNVTFVNSPLNDKTRGDRALRAQETANVVQFRYPDVARLNAIWVVFVRERRTLVFIDERQSVDYYGFDNKGMRMSTSTGPTTSTSMLQTSTNYLKDEDETDIAVNGIQLDGTPGAKGVTVLPHFRVKGDLRSDRSEPPKTVMFDFASYSDHEEFQPNTPVAFIADGKPVIALSATFGVSKSSGNVTEFLPVSVPYPKFREMLDAQHLSFGLGAKLYPLTPSQFDAMKQMVVFVKE